MQSTGNTLLNTISHLENIIATVTVMKNPQNSSIETKFHEISIVTDENTHYEHR